MNRPAVSISAADATIHARKTSQIPNPRGRRSVCARSSRDSNKPTAISGQMKWLNPRTHHSGSGRKSAYACQPRGSLRRRVVVPIECSTGITVSNAPPEAVRGGDDEVRSKDPRGHEQSEVSSRLPRVQAQTSFRIRPRFGRLSRGGEREGDLAVYAGETRWLLMELWILLEEI